MFFGFDQLFFKMFVKSFGRKCQNFFQLVERTVLSNLFSKSSCTSIFCWLSTEILWTFRKTVVVKTWPDESVFGSVFTEKDNFRNASGLRSESHWFFEQIFCSCLSKMLSKCLEKCSGGSSFLKENFYIFS